ncbi:MAG TPA: DUF5939 domain-containing protein, partial [Candidatus Acidoferrum sp.]|nr:DUF5939 domain-containing protein [Candidatus Acidoferrum sp.]
MGYRPISVEAHRNFSLSPGVLWDLLANTDSLNREIGIPTVAFGPVVVDADGFYRQAAARFWGRLRMRWREYPFEWVRGERYAVLRAFEAGFLDTFYGGAEPSAKEDGTSVHLFAEVSPRTLLGWGIARVMGWKGIRDTLAYCERFAATRQTEIDLLVPPSSGATPVNQARLDQLVAALLETSLPRDLVMRFARHLSTAADPEVLRMQPYAIADGWGVERSEVLRLFIEAARLGGLSYTWEVMCPNCRVSHGQPGSLTEVPSSLHCEGCAMDYGADLSQNVELRYSVHPSVRAAKNEVHCIGGPANTPYVWLQQYLLPETERTVSVTLPNEEFRARVVRVHMTCPLEPDFGGSS